MTHTAVISRVAAKSVGLGWYFTGRSCARGHIAKRHTNTGNCHSCRQIACLKWKEANTARALQGIAEWHRANSEKRYWLAYRHAKRIPLWADLEKIKFIYAQCAEMCKSGILFEVDHIVPVQSELVCGFHVENNLEIITKKENRSKGNRYWPGFDWILS